MPKMSLFSVVDDRKQKSRHLKTTISAKNAMGKPSFTNCSWRLSKKTTTAIPHVAAMTDIWQQSLMDINDQIPSWFYDFLKLVRIGIEMKNHTTSRSASTTSSKVAWNASTNFKNWKRKKDMCHCWQVILTRSINKQCWHCNLLMHLSLPEQANQI